mmetsp:Transcript_33441/g.108201  ORF Transcript_33441/g.108201 Transcript_33441/m.108201 type:complete len:287 (-) Transcript_33441:218-1078(-)
MHPQVHFHLVRRHVRRQLCGCAHRAEEPDMPVGRLVGPPARPGPASYGSRLSQLLDARQQRTGMWREYQLASLGQVGCDGHLFDGLAGHKIFPAAALAAHAEGRHGPHANAHVERQVDPVDRGKIVELVQQLHAAPDRLYQQLAQRSRIVRAHIGRSRSRGRSGSDLPVAGRVAVGAPLLPSPVGVRRRNREQLVGRGRVAPNDLQRVACKLDHVAPRLAHHLDQLVEVRVHVLVEQLSAAPADLALQLLAECCEARDVHERDGAQETLLPRRGGLDRVGHDPLHQ